MGDFPGSSGDAVPTTPPGPLSCCASSASPCTQLLSPPHPSVSSESKFTLITVIYTVSHQLVSRTLGGPNWEGGREGRKERKPEAVGPPRVDCELRVLASPPEIALEGRVGSWVFER